MCPICSSSRPRLVSSLGSRKRRKSFRGKAPKVVDPGAARFGAYGDGRVPVGQESPARGKFRLRPKDSSREDFSSPTHAHTQAKCTQEVARVGWAVVDFGRKFVDKV